MIQSTPTYQPSRPPSADEVAQWAYSQFRRISDSGDRGLAREMEVEHAPPAKPQEGWIRAADGTDWDPGAGAGAYIFLHGVWQSLGGGGSSAPGPGSITHDMLQSGIIWNVNLQDASVTTSKLGDAAVLTIKIGDLQITANKLADGSVTTPKIFDDAVLTSKLGDLAVSLQKLGVGAVDFSKLVDGAVQTVKIGNDAVTAAKIAALAVGTSELDVGAVTTAKISAGAVTSDQIGAFAILAQNIGAGQVQATQIGAQAVTTGKLAAGVVTANELAVGAVTASRIATGAITANEIATGAIVTAKIAAGAVTTTQLAAGAVTAAIIAAGAITATQIAVGSISIDRIAASSGNYNGTFFRLGFGTTVGGIASGGSFDSVGTGSFGLIVTNQASFPAPALGVGSSNHGIAATFVSGTDSFFNGFTTRAQLACGNTSSMAGYFEQGSFSNALPGTINSSIRLAYAGYAAYLNGPVGPFTGSHDCLLSKTGAVPEVGDIIVDTSTVVIRGGISDTLLSGAVSTTANQKRAIGIFVKRSASGMIPQAMAKMSNSLRSQERWQVDPRYTHLFDDYVLGIVNSIGEGLINVCGQNGNIQAGDFIVCSDTPGKGMKQADNIYRSVTVAKAREDVTFANAAEVKRGIACVYLPG